jgi:TPR repeat protein
MTVRHPLLTFLAAVLLTTSAQAQQRKPATPAPTAKPAASAPASAPANDEGDAAYAAFQRGLYVTAFKEATKRAEEKSDPKAMTLLGELYADGLGVPSDDKKAAEWYKLASDRGDADQLCRTIAATARRPLRSQYSG